MCQPYPPDSFFIKLDTLLDFDNQEYRNLNKVPEYHSQVDALSKFVIFLYNGSACAKFINVYGTECKLSLKARGKVEFFNIPEEESCQECIVDENNILRFLIPPEVIPYISQDISCSSKKYKVLAEPEQKRKFLYNQVKVQIRLTDFGKRTKIRQLSSDLYSIYQRADGGFGVITEKGERDKIIFQFAGDKIYYSGYNKWHVAWCILLLLFLILLIYIFVHIYIKIYLYLLHH